MLPGPALYVFIVTLLREQRGEVARASWLGAAMYLAAALAAFTIWWGIVRFPRYLRKMGSDMLAKEKDPIALYGICGLALFHYPSALALFLSFAGLPLRYLVGTAAFSMIGTMWWLTSYRQRAEDAGIPSAP